MNHKCKLIISCLLVVLWMVVIFLFSSMDSETSNSDSKNIIHNVVSVTNYNDSIIEKDNIVDKLNEPLRKVMHMTEYLILSLLLVNTLTLCGVSFRKRLILTLMVCFLYALTDEFHQTFVDGRTGQLLDSIIDTFGSIVGLSLYIFFYHRKKKDSADRIKRNNNYSFSP